MFVNRLETIGWRINSGRVDYPDAVAFMERRVDGVAARSAHQLVWLLEHPPVYTAGTSARQESLLVSDRFPVHQTGRGGQYTYHGPGQRVGYVLMDLRLRNNDVRKFVYDLESWLIETLSSFNVRGERRSGRVGIWVQRKSGREDKIAALGIRVRKGISFHGVSLNVEPDLEHFSGIIPCGISEHGITSLADLGVTATMPDVDLALRDSFHKIFGATEIEE